jgi:DNA-binding transcriptional LysR family regulator
MTRYWTPPTPRPTMKTDRTHHGTERDPVDTELLRTFVAVVECRSFTAAARELGYVQSTVTGHVQTLERRLGARLLDRLPTGAVPTEAGLRLLPYAEQLLGLRARMGDEVPAAGRAAGTVRLIAPELFATLRLPALVAAVRAAAPAIRLTLTPGGTGRPDAPLPAAAGSPAQSPRMSRQPSQVTASAT